MKSLGRQDTDSTKISAQNPQMSAEIDYMKNLDELLQKIAAEEKKSDDESHLATYRIHLRSMKEELEKENKTEYASQALVIIDEKIKHITQILAKKNKKSRMKQFAEGVLADEVVPVEKSEIKQERSIQEPVGNKADEKKEPPPEVEIPEFKKPIITSENKSERDNNLPPRLAVNIIAYLAKKYINEINTTQLYSLDPRVLEELFQNALAKMNEMDPITIDDTSITKVMDVFNINRGNAYSVNSVNARKIVALLSIYTKAVKFLQTDNIQEKEQAWKETQNAIKEASTDLKNNFNDIYSTFFTAPKRYVETLTAISIVGRTYIHERAISSATSGKPKEAARKIRKKLEEKRKPYKALFESYEETADNLLTRAETYDALKQIKSRDAEEKLKEITTLDAATITQMLYDLSDFSDLTYAQISKIINEQFSENNVDIKNNIILQLNHIYESKLLSTDYDKLLMLKDELRTNPEKKQEILNEIERILADLTVFKENRKVKNKTDPNIPIIENVIHSMGKPLSIAAMKPLSILIENKESAEILEYYRKQLGQIIRTMCQNKISISTLIGDATGNNITNCKFILKSIADDKSTKNEFFKQLNNAQIEREGIVEACQYCFDLSDDPTNIIQQKPFAHSILEHHDANLLEIDALLRLASYLPLKDAIHILDHNPVIDKPKKDALLTALHHAQNFKENIEFNANDFHQSSIKLYEQIRKCLDNGVSVDLLRMKLNAVNESKMFEKVTQALNILHASRLPFNLPEDQENVRAIQNIISTLMLIKSNSTMPMINTIIRILTPEMAHEIFDTLPEDVKGIYAKHYLSQIDVGYDFALMSSMPEDFRKSSRGVVYIEGTEKGLGYKVVDDHNTLRSGVIPWDQLNINTKDPLEIIKHKKQTLPLVINEISKDKNAQSKVKSALTSSYSDSLTEKKHDFADLFEIFSRSEDDIAKHQTLASAIITNTNMRQWLLDHNIEFRSVLSVVVNKLAEAEPDYQAMNLFNNWSKEDLDKALAISKPDHQWLIYLALLSNADVINSENPEVFNNYLNRLELHKLTARQIELIPKNIRIAYLKNLGPWTNGKALLGGTPPSNKRLREMALSLTKGFEPNDIQKLCTPDENGNVYETALISAFGQAQHMDSITTFITSGDPSKMNKKKLGWDLLTELDHGIWNKTDNSQLHIELNKQNKANMTARGALYAVNIAFYYVMDNTLGAIGNAPVEGSAPVADDSFRNRLMIKSVYDYDGTEEYTPEMCDLIQLECETNSTYFFLNAKIPAIKMALKNPVILSGLFMRLELLSIMQKVIQQGLLPSELSEIINSFQKSETPGNQENYYLMLLSTFPMSLSTYLDKNADSFKKDNIEKEKSAIIELYNQYSSNQFPRTNRESYNSYDDNLFINILKNKYDPTKPQADLIVDVTSEITFANPFLLQSLLKKHKDHSPQDSTAKKWIKRIFKGALMGIGVFLVAKLFALIIPKVASLFLTSGVLGPIAGVAIAGAGATTAVLGGFAIVPVLIALSVSAVLGALVYSFVADRKERLVKKLMGGPSTQDKLDFKVLKQGLSQIKDDDKKMRQALYLMSNDLAKTVLYHQSIGQDIMKESNISPDIIDMIKLATTKCYNASQTTPWRAINVASHPVRAIKIKTQFNPTEKKATTTFPDIGALAQANSPEAEVAQATASQTTMQELTINRAPSYKYILESTSELSQSENKHDSKLHTELRPSAPSKKSFMPNFNKNKVKEKTRKEEKTPKPPKAAKQKRTK